MFDKFDTRSQSLERLDTGDYTPAEYARWLKETWWINRYLGDVWALRSWLNGRFKNSDTLSVLDVGAGSGELLIAAAEMTDDKSPLLVGAELSAEAAGTIAQRRGLTAIRCNALMLPFADDSFDAAISSLFLHHLTDHDAVTLIKEMDRVARSGFVIIDLNRKPMPYYLYSIFGRLFFQQLTVEDGLLSIRRAFRPPELLRIAREAGVLDAVVETTAFRLVLSGGTSAK